MIARHGLDVHEAGATTLSEYAEYSFAYAVERQEKERYAAFQAWMNQGVQAQVNKGTEKKPNWESKYRQFDEFYDEERYFNSLFGKSEGTEEKKQKETPLTLADKNRLLSRTRKEETNG